MDRFGVPGTARASFAMYNTPEEVDCSRTPWRRSSPRRPAEAFRPGRGRRRRLPGGRGRQPAGGGRGAGRGLRFPGRLAGSAPAPSLSWAHGLPPLPEACRRRRTASTAAGHGVPATFASGRAPGCGRVLGGRQRRHRPRPARRAGATSAEEGGWKYRRVRRDQVPRFG